MRTRECQFKSGIRHCGAILSYPYSWDFQKDKERGARIVKQAVHSGTGTEAGLKIPGVIEGGKRRDSPKIEHGIEQVFEVTELGSLDIHGRLISPTLTAIGMPRGLSFLRNWLWPRRTRRAASRIAGQGPAAARQFGLARAFADGRVMPHGMMIRDRFVIWGWIFVWHRIIVRNRIGRRLMVVRE